MNSQNPDHARDLTQKERLDCFGTKDDRAIKAICDTENIQYYRRPIISLSIVIWRCHLSKGRELLLSSKEATSTIYVKNILLSK